MPLNLTDKTRRLAIDFAEVSAHLRGTRRDWLPAAFPHGRIRAGNFEIGDEHGTPGKSLPIPLNGGSADLRDFGGTFSGDDLDLYARAYGLDLATAAAEVAERAGLGRGQRRSKPASSPQPAPSSDGAVCVMPVPADAPSPPAPIGAYWEYLTADGELLYRVDRKERPDGGKDFYPHTLWRTAAGAYEWRSKHPPAPRPLYGLPDLSANPRARVLVVEGEKAADAARELAPAGYVIVAASAGSNAGHLADWSPLAGRHVTIWPDADVAGAKYAGIVAEQCHKAGAAAVAVVRLPGGLPTGWDLADPAPHGVPVDIDRLMSEAEAVDPPAPDAPEVGEPFEPETIPLDFDPTRIEPRQWMVGTRLMVGAVTVGVAPGGVGKTTFGVLTAIATATGRGLTGEKIWKSGPTLIVNNEETGTELRRRIAAAMRHHGVANAEIHGKLWMYSGVDKDALVVARKDEDGTIVATPRVHALKAFIQEHDIRYLTCDPFIRTYEGLEENRNDEMHAAVNKWVRIAAETGCAIELMHHAAKGGGDRQGHVGKTASGRGASAITDAARRTYTLAPMDDREADEYGLGPAEWTQFVRLDDGKVNNAARSGEPTWLRLVPVCIGNGTPDYPDGDSVAVLEPFDMSRLAEARQREAYAAQEPERERIAQMVADAMPTNECGIGDVLAVLMGELGVQKTVAREKVEWAIPLVHNGFRQVRRGGEICRLHRFKASEHRTAPMRLRLWRDPND